MGQPQKILVPSKEVRALRSRIKGHVDGRGEVADHAASRVPQAWAMGRREINSEHDRQAVKQGDQRQQASSD